MKKICIFTWTQVGAHLTDLPTRIQAAARWMSIASVPCFQVLATLGCPGQGHRQPACIWHFCLGLTSCPFLSRLTSAHSSTASQLSNTVVYLIRAISGLEGINLQSCFAFPSLGRCTNPLKASDLQSQPWPSCPPLQLTSLQEFVEFLWRGYVPSELSSLGDNLKLAPCLSYCSSLQPYDYAMLVISWNGRCWGPWIFSMAFSKYVVLTAALHKHSLAVSHVQHIQPFIWASSLLIKEKDLLNVFSQLQWNSCPHCFDNVYPPRLQSFLYLLSPLSFVWTSMTHC